MSLRIPTDMDILDCCEDQAKNTYQIAKTLKINYPNYALAVKHITKLCEMGLLQVSRKEKGRGPTGEVKYFLATAKGVAILRGYKEGTR